QARQGTRFFRVPAMSLDGVLGQFGLEVVNLLKMDIEGAEGSALQGLQKALNRRLVEKILLELHPAQLAEHGRSVSDIIDQLCRLRSRPWQVDHSPLASRQVAYRRHVNLRAILRPLHDPSNLDSWPHVFWTLPEWEPPC